MIRTPVPELDALLDELAANARAILGPQLVGTYLAGSLATGDFELDRSDVDFVVMTDGAVPPGVFAALAAMHGRLAKRAPRWGLELEGSYVPAQALRRHDPRPAAHPHIERCSAELVMVRPATGYWVIHRHLLREHGITVSGPAPRTLIDPVEPAQLRLAVGGILAEWWAPMLEDRRQLQNSFYRCYAVLTMCRMLYTLQEGAIVSKRAAAQWTADTVSRRWAPLIDRALAWSAEAPPDLDETLALIRSTCERGGVL